MNEVARERPRRAYMAETKLVCTVAWPYGTEQHFAGVTGVEFPNAKVEFGTLELRALSRSGDFPGCGLCSVTIPEQDKDRFFQFCQTYFSKLGIEFVTQITIPNK